jgi:hypothetical protein
MGNEYLFRTQARHDIELLNAVETKEVITCYRNCLNNIGREYSILGDDYDINPVRTAEALSTGADMVWGGVLIEV